MEMWAAEQSISDFCPAIKMAIMSVHSLTIAAANFCCCHIIANWILANFSLAAAFCQPNDCSANQN